MILNYQYLRLKLWSIQEALIEYRIVVVGDRLRELRTELNKEERKDEDKC